MGAFSVTVSEANAPSYPEQRPADSQEWWRLCQVHGKGWRSKGQRILFLFLIPGPEGGSFFVKDSDIKSPVSVTERDDQKQRRQRFGGFG